MRLPQTAEGDRLDRSVARVAEASIKEVRRALKAGLITIAGKATAVIWPPRRDGGWNWRRLTPPAAFDGVPDGS